MSDFETNLVVMTSFAVGGMGIVALVGWIVQHTMKREADDLHQRAEEQARTLAGVSTELHRARADLAALRGVVEGVRGEVDMLAHGPPSLRSPQGPRGKLS